MKKSILLNTIYSFTILLLLCNGSCNSSKSISSKNVNEVQKPNIEINGVSLEAPRNIIDSTHFINLQRINAGWVAFIPFAFSKKNDPMVRYNSTGQWWGETENGIIECIKMAHAQNLKVMLKPQVWVGGGEYIGYYKLETEEAWLQWQVNYSDYILQHAKTAQKYNVEMFCVGTEMDEAVLQRPAYWRQLIDSVKMIYKGKLTYAANWSTFKSFASWDQLDYIGIDAYFPLDSAATPTLDNLAKGWQPHFDDIKNFQALNKKPILFTEFGYRSIDKTAFEPWQSYTKAPLNMQAQANAYEALFKKFGAEEWFAGGFLWKWESRDLKERAATNTNFTPQHKPVENIIKKWYAKNE